MTNDNNSFLLQPLLTPTTADTNISGKAQKKTMKEFYYLLPTLKSAPWQVWLRFYMVFDVVLLKKFVKRATVVLQEKKKLVKRKQCTAKNITFDFVLYS